MHFIIMWAFQSSSKAEDLTCPCPKLNKLKPFVNSLRKHVVGWRLSTERPQLTLDTMATAVPTSHHAIYHFNPPRLCFKVLSAFA